MGKTETGKKDDVDKMQWSLMPWEQLETVLEVLEYGANKYGPYNWQQLENARDRYFSAALRHLLTSQIKDDDNESGLPHLAHAVCNLLFLLWFERNKK